MKGIVLAGGTGSRLRPITHTMPKQMLPIGGRPVLEYAVRNLRDAGITDIGIVLGEHGHDEIVSHFDDGSELGVDITYIYQGEPLGLGHAVGCTEKFVRDDPFVLFLGDDLIQGGLSAFVDRFDADRYAGAIAVKPVDDPSRYGVVKTNDAGDVVGMIEKPSEPPTNLAGIGVFVLTPAIFDEIRELEPSWRGEVELSDAIHRLLSQEKMFQSYTVDGWWFDVGTPEDVLAANRAVLDGLDADTDHAETLDNAVVGHVAMAETAEVHPEATVRGPVSLGEDVVVGPGSYVGPYTSLSRGVTVEGAAVESSVVLADATLSGDVRLIDSVVGRSSTVGGAEDRPEGTRLLVGTDTEVLL